MQNLVPQTPTLTNHPYFCQTFTSFIKKPSLVPLYVPKTFFKNPHLAIYHLGSSILANNENVIHMYLCFSGIIALLSLHALNNLHIFMALAQGCFPCSSTNWPTTQSALTHTDHPFFTYKPTSSSRMGQDHGGGARLLAVVLAP